MTYVESMGLKLTFFAGKQYHTTDDLWDAIMTAADEVSTDDIKNLTSSMDKRLFSVISNNGTVIPAPMHQNGDHLLSDTQLFSKF